MLRVVLPDWQGYGESTESAVGARALAAAWWGDSDATVINPPEFAPLPTESGVLGLTSLAAMTTRLGEALQHAAPLSLQMVGGTCAAELAPVAYFNERYDGDLAVVWLDGHADLNTPGTSPSGHFHGMVLRTLLGEGPAALASLVRRPLAPEQVFLVGSRDLDPAEREYIASHPVTWLPGEAFSNPGRLTDAITAAGFGHVYLHFDVDAIAPTDFGNALMRADDGPLMAEVADVVSTIHRHTNVVGFSVLEYVDRLPKDRDRLVTLLRSAELFGCCR